jgi:hypothetical protein
MKQQAILPAKDSGNLPFTLSVPQSWLVKGVWPVPKDTEDGFVHLCGGKNTLTLSLQKYASSSLSNVLSSFAVPKKKHPDRYFSVKVPAGQGALILVPISHESGIRGAPRDLITGRIYCGSNRVLFYEYSFFDRKATVDDRKLMLSILQTVKLK